MNKWIYRALGGSLYISSLFLFSWFYGDIFHMLTHVTNIQYSVKIFSPILCIYLGIFYSIYGLRNERINKLSNLSIYVLVVSFIISLILLYGFAQTATLGRIIMPSGLVFSVILSIISFFYKE
ncbi:MAG: hypothetical protein ABIH28_03395 [archaeon]